MFTYIAWAQVQIALGRRALLGAGFLPLTSLALLAIVGAYFVKARRIRRGAV